MKFKHLNLEQYQEDIFKIEKIQITNLHLKISLFVLKDDFNS